MQLHCACIVQTMPGQGYETLTKLLPLASGVPRPTYLRPTYIALTIYRVRPTNCWSCTRTAITLAPLHLHTTCPPVRAAKILLTVASHTPGRDCTPAWELKRSNTCRSLDNFRSSSLQQVRSKRPRQACGDRKHLPTSLTQTFKLHKRIMVQHHHSQQLELPHQ